MSFRRNPSNAAVSKQHSRRTPPRKVGDEILSPINASIKLDNEQYLQKLQKFQSVKNPVKKVKDNKEDPLVLLLQKLSGEQLWKEISEFHRTTQVLYEASYFVYSGKWDEITNIPKRDYTHYRYTPIVSQDADEFTFDGYKLRFQRDGLSMKMMVGITIYNEEFKELEQTMLGICEAIEHMHQKNLVNWWEVVLVIVQDGVQKLHSSVPAALEQLGLFNDEVMYDKNRLGEKTTAHLFEYTSRIRKEDDSYFPPLQTCFLTKTENRGKLSSHTWVFKCFAQNFTPDQIVLFDAGTRPYPSSLSYINKFFTRNPTIGACCGELEVDSPFKNGLLSSIQYLEWKFSYILEIPFNHICGFLTVLPGAFSAYRWEAIQGVPLSKYFEGFYRELVMSPFYRNVYLAEDRVLCMEIVAKKDCNYRLGYVKQAVARADTPTTLNALLRQRRRWLNGTFFAMMYDFMNFYRVWTESGHNIFRKLILTFEFIYLMLVTLVNSWLGIGIIFIFCFMLLYQLTPVFRIWFPFLHAVSQEIAWVMVFIYIFFLLLELITSINNKPDYAVRWHWLSAIVFLGYTCIFTAVTVWYVVSDIIQGVASHNLSNIRTSTYLIVAMTILVVIIVILHGQLKALVFAGVPYYLFTSAYINVLQVYAFTNTHDISWGTKDLNKLSEGSHETKEENVLKGKQDYKVRVEQRRRKQKIPSWEEAEKVILAREAVLKRFSTYFILTWVVSNLFIAFLVFYIAGLTNTLSEGANYNYYNVYVEIIFYGVSVLRLFQVIASFYFICKFYIGMLSRRKHFQPSYGPVTEHSLNPPFLLKAKGTTDSSSDLSNPYSKPPTNGIPPQGRLANILDEEATPRANSNQPLLVNRGSQEGGIEMTPKGDNVGARKGSDEGGLFMSPAQKHMVNKVEKQRKQELDDARFHQQELDKANKEPKGKYLNQGILDDTPLTAHPQGSIEEVRGSQQAPNLNVTGGGYNNRNNYNLNVTGSTYNDGGLNVTGAGYSPNNLNVTGGGVNNSPQSYNNYENSNRQSIPQPQEAVSYNSNSNQNIFAHGRSASSLVEEEDFEQRYNRIKQQQQKQQNRGYNNQPSYLTQQSSFNTDDLTITPQGTSSFKGHNDMSKKLDQSGEMDLYMDQSGGQQNQGGGQQRQNRYSNQSQLSDISER